MTLLQKLAQDQHRERERLRLEMRGRLRETLAQIIPGYRVLVFGSLLQPGKFNEHSDIDLALESEPEGMSIYQLISLAGERIGRRADVMLLDECRFKDKILKDGELWILPA